MTASRFSDLQFQLQYAAHMIHPPVGLNLFVASHLSRMGLAEVSLATLPWVFVMLAYLVLVTYVPAISLIRLRNQTAVFMPVSQSFLYQSIPP
ncbi:MAG TPA: TRAP transporter large permease subunit [Gallionellaceae bacterium]